MPHDLGTPTVNHIKDLIPDPENARDHDARNIGMIVESLQHVGAARSIVIDEENRILAGNGTVEAAAQAGIVRVRVVDASGDEIIAVRRSGLSDNEKRALALYDNRTTDLSTFDPEQLQQFQAEGFDLSSFFSQAELDDIISAAAARAGVGGDGVESIRVEEPKTVCWVLVAVPVEQWPAAQAAVRQLRDCAVFTTSALRGSGDARDEEPEGDPDATP